MSFVMIATGATSRSRVRTLSLPLVAAGAAALAALLFGAGGAAGYWLAAPLALVHAAAPASTVITALPRAAALPFTLEQLGAISARLFRLESQASQLGKRIGVLPKEGSGIEPRPTEKTPGRGGPMLPARVEAADLQSLDAQLARLEGQIGEVAAAASQRHVDAMRMPTRWPVRNAEMSSPFGNRSDPFSQRHAFHAGLDFAAEYGTPILAAAGGRVAFAGFRSDYGWMVEIVHGNGLATRYAHASRLLVNPGAVVVPGERIAQVGSTGRSTGAHLHFEVLRDGAQIDPKRYLARM
ncbi:MAG: M23 family metallopeptidase [Burkholderiaceae bacterium]